MPERFTRRTVPKIMFANCGHGPNRRLEDMVKYSFISAGHGLADGRDAYYFSNQIRNLIVNDIIAVYRNRLGYVGIARVKSHPMLIGEAILDGKKVTPEMFIGKMFDSANEPGYAECLVEIEWLTGVHLREEEASGACYGMFASRLVVCSLKQTQLKKGLEETFRLNFQELLDNPLLNPLDSLRNG